MTNLTINLEELLETELYVAENQVGLGKVVYNELNNESIVTNGKSLITYSDTKLKENKSLTSFEKERVINLTNNLIHNNFGYLIACEFYFSKEDLGELISYMERYKGEAIKLTFNNRLNVVMASIEGSPSLVKILTAKQINDYKHGDSVVTVSANELYVISKLIHSIVTTEDEVIGVAIQHNDAPLLIETESKTALACISCIKK